MITYDFPPIGKGNVLRPFKFAKYFPKYGWEPVILTSTPKSYFFRDEYLLNEANRLGMKIYRTKGPKKNLLTGSKLKKLPNESSRSFRLRIAKTTKLPDEYKSWIRKAVKLGSNIIETNEIEIIYATAPPFSCLVAAGELKEKYKIPLVIDYQDSWLHSPTSYFPMGYHRLRNMKMEQDVIRVTDEIVAVNRRIKEYLIEEYDYLKHEDINIVSHGFDEEDFSNVQGLPEKTRMRFTHTGGFFNQSTPEYFFEALAMVFNKRPDLRGKIEACFIGQFTMDHLNLIKKYNISDSILNPGYLNHNETIKYMLASDVLWFMVGKGEGCEVITPVKLSEYFGARKPILACVPDGAAKQLVKNYEAARICEPDEPRQIANLIAEYYDLLQKREMPLPNEEFIKKFDVDKLSYQLIRYFEFLRDIPPGFGIKEKEMITND